MTSPISHRHRMCARPACSARSSLSACFSTKPCLLLVVFSRACLHDSHGSAVEKMHTIKSVSYASSVFVNFMQECISLQCTMTLIIIYGLLAL
jgi:hypothetical protein